MQTKKQQPDFQIKTQMLTTLDFVSYNFDMVKKYL